MIDNKSRLGLAFGFTLLAGATMLTGCGTPDSHTATDTRTTTTTTQAPVPVISTTTSTTEDTQDEAPVVNHRPMHYAMHHHPIHRAIAKDTTESGEKTTTSDTTVTPMTVTTKTDKVIDTSTTTK